MPHISRIDRARYLTQQLGLSLQATALQETARAIARIPRPRFAPAVLREIQRRYRGLLDLDLANVEAGLYPRDLLFQIPLAEYARTFPSLVRDAPRTVRRMRRGDYRDLPASIELADYPAYYRRTFHWQTDGYLSDHSAALYDLGVELLFRGTADVMRRQVIPPISRFLAETCDPRSRLLDVACGTGRTLRQLATAHPALRLYGVDLSPYYVRAARALLRDVGHAALSVDNAEALPFADAAFDVVTSVYLFHELPRAARRRVAAELARVARPGGVVVVEDSAQLADSPELSEVLASFAATYHEPFYDDYTRDDLAALLESAGLEVLAIEPVMVAKVVVARRPAH
jgi:ubiquinone/menaquinone biosynthesis C-methylase UbiE